MQLFLLSLSRMGAEQPNHNQQQPSSSLRNKYEHNPPSLSHLQPRTDAEQQMLKDAQNQPQRKELRESRIIGKDNASIDFVLFSLWTPKKVSLLFRASEHGFRAASFHQHCDNIPHTLVLVQTEFGKVIGGYTRLTWSSQFKLEFKADDERRTFIFSVSLREKMGLVKPELAIQCKSNYGPVFGGGDIFISDDCKEIEGSFSYFPGSFNSNYPQFKQSGWTAFCGAPDGYNFHVLEYEVYRVEW